MSDMDRAEACSKYIRLLKDVEELTQEELALARESFDEGWQQCELIMGKGA